MDEISYCPVCLSFTIELEPKIVVALTVNGLKRDNGSFIYKFEEPHSKLVSSLELKLKEFFEWYSSFQNKKTVEEIQLLTTNASCRNHCKIPHDNKINLVGIIINKKELVEILNKTAEHYKISTLFRC